MQVLLSARPRMASAALVGAAGESETIAAGAGSKRDAVGASYHIADARHCRDRSA